MRVTHPLVTFVLGASAAALTFAVGAHFRPDPPTTVTVAAPVATAPAPATPCTPDTVWTDAASGRLEAAREAEAEAEAARAAAEQAREESRREAVRAAEARSLAQRKTAHDALQQTAMRIASDVQAWVFRPAAFGGGDGSLDNLGFEPLGYAAGPDGRFSTVDGLFRMSVDGETVTIRGEHRDLDLGTTVEVIYRSPDTVDVVVDGREYRGTSVR